MGHHRGLDTGARTQGVPTFRSAPSPTASTWSITISWPTSAAICSTLIFSPAATLYCLPPVFMTAYMSALSMSSAATRRARASKRCRSQSSMPRPAAARACSTAACASPATASIAALATGRPTGAAEQRPLPIIAPQLQAASSRASRSLHLPTRRRVPVSLAGLRWPPTCGRSTRVIRERLASDVALIDQIAHYIIGAGGKRMRPRWCCCSPQALGLRRAGALRAGGGRSSSSTPRRCCTTTSSTNRRCAAAAQTANAAVRQRRQRAGRRLPLLARLPDDGRR